MGKKHKIHGHHIIENHNGVRVKTDKIIEVTPEEHHKIHKEYYEKWGFWQDKLAYQGLGGYKDKEEIIWEAQSEGGKKGRKSQIENDINVWDSETAKKISPLGHDALEKKYGYRNGNWKGRKHKTSSKIKIGKKNSIYQKGDGNSQYGTFWITDGINSKKCSNESLIPEGWSKGRKVKNINEHK